MGMVEWNLGVFTVMTIMATLIVGILAIRFVYIGAAYTQAIDRYEKIMEYAEGDIESGAGKNIPDASEHVLSYQELMGNYRARRENNTHLGAFIDIIIIAQILVVGSLATLGVFANNVWVMILSLFFLFSISAIHFAISLNALKKEKL